MSSGTVMGVSPRRAHFSIGSGNGFYLYWHARLVNRLGPGSRVTRGEFVADVQAGRHHVHVAESESGCGLVDPRRPTGVLRDPENQERPRIGPISAYIADRHAFAPVDTEVDPAQLSDPATPLSLDDLHGAVDFRASLTDIPVHKMRHQPQIPLEVAAIRGYLAPAENRRRVLGTVRRVYDGARFFRPTAGIWHVWAFGTFRQNLCYKTAHGPCAADYVWHVGGPHGWDVNRIPNGHYQYCVQAITINGIKSHRCTPVTVRHN